VRAAFGVTLTPEVMGVGFGRADGTLPLT